MKLRILPPVKRVVKIKKPKPILKPRFRVLPRISQALSDTCERRWYHPFAGDLRCCMEKGHKKRCRNFPLGWKILAPRRES